jgi:hypothetical protein
VVTFSPSLNPWFVVVVTTSVPPFTLETFREFSLWPSGSSLIVRSSITLTEYGVPLERPPIAVPPFV